jgi:hypothetical protein
VDFSSIPAGGIRAGVTPQQQAAELANICARATAMVDAECAQPLRATIDPLELTGPGVRVRVPRDPCTAKPSTLIATRWPVLSVVSVQVSRNTFPQAWTPVPAGNYAPATPVTGLYGSVAPPSTGEGGQGIRLAAGYVDWAYGPDGYLIQASYVNGWPHCGLTAAATAGATSLTVDDCTGWAVTSALGSVTGATGTVYDAGAQEVIHVASASAAQGPGTLTLSSPLAFAHAAGVMVTTMPQSVTWAAILFCASQALTRGATSTTVREIPGGRQEGGSGASDLAKKACAILAPFKRII